VIIVLLLITSGAIALFYERQIEDTMPMSVFLISLLAYALAITNHLSRVLQLGYICCVFVAVLFIFLYMRKNNQGIAAAFMGLLGKYKSCGLLCFAVATVLTCVLFSSHFVTNWDDFNYWAMFSKNIAAADGMVSGAKECSLFKDYTPIVQLLYYVVFKSFGGFNEAYMFMVNNVLLVLFLMPFLKRQDDELLSHWLVKSGAALLFPVATMLQQFHCLGVDCILSMLFGYILLQVFTEKRRDFFFYVNLALALSFLMLTKSAAVLLVSVALICVLIEESGAQKKIIGLFAFVPAFAALASWRLFCRLAGNSSYLTDRAAGNLSTAGFLKLPEYAGEFFGKFVKAVLFMRLNGSVIGITPAICLVFSAAVLIRLLGKNKAIYVLLTGFVLYLISLIYTYLFVFDKWEALSLSSFDRYISIYLIAMVYLALFCVLTGPLKVRLALLIIFLATLNFPLLAESFLPGGYEKKYESIKSGREEVAERASEFYAENPEAYGGRVLIVNEKRNNELEKYQQYEMVPTVTFIYCLEERGDGEIENELTDHSLDYVFYYQ